MKQIIGSWQDLRGNPASHGRLYAYLNQDAVASSASQIVPREVFFYLDHLGALTEGSALWANDELSPSNTFYRLVVTSLGGGVIWGPEYLVLAGAEPIDLTTIVPGGGLPPVIASGGVAV